MADTTETKDLGVVTAYGEACEAGYTGTYEEFCTMLANLKDAEANAKAYAEQAAKSAQDVKAISNIDVMTGATADAEGKGGIVPAPPAGSQNQYLGGDAKYHDINLSPMTGATADADGTSGLVPAPPQGSQDKYLGGDGTYHDINLNTMEGATADTAGTSGLTPAPSAGDQDKALFGDGTYREIPQGLYFTELSDTTATS